MSASPPASGCRAIPPSTTRQSQWTIRRRTDSVARTPHLTERYHVTWLDHSGGIATSVRVGPQIALFEDAFTALARGALISTVDGPVAVEDIQPGCEVLTDVGARTLRWKGSLSISPANRPSTRLYRIPSDALGLARPATDLMLGPAARIVSRRSTLRDANGAGAALMPIAPLADGTTVVEITPISPVQTYHLGFAQHCLFTANGIELESVHPGRMNPMLGDDLYDLYLSMFPHLSCMRDFGGLVLPRIAEDEVHTIIAA